MKLFKRLMHLLKVQPLTPEEISLPQEVILELTNRCNLKCVMCHIHSPYAKGYREQGIMSESLWKKAIDEIGSWEHPVNLSTFGAGEPLLHPQIVDVVKYAKTKPNITVGFLTNAMLLNKSKSEELIKTGIDWIAVSLDGMEAQFVESYRKGSNLETIEKNLRNLIELKDTALTPVLKINMVLIPEGESQVEGFIEKWLPHINEIMLSKYRDIGERVFLDREVLRSPCYLLEKMLVLGWNGDVGLCCEDIFIEHKMGDFKQSSLQEVWCGAPFTHTRKLHRDNKYGKIKLCKECHVYSTDKIVRQYKDKKGYTITEHTNQTVYVRHA